jgi:hypothetical protein
MLSLTRDIRVVKAFATECRQQCWFNAASISKPLLSYIEPLFSKRKCREPSWTAMRICPSPKQLASESLVSVTRASSALELITNLVFLVGIGWYFLGILPTNTQGKLGWYILVSKNWREPFFTVKSKKGVRSLYFIFYHLGGCSWRINSGTPARLNLVEAPLLGLAKDRKRMEYSPSFTLRGAGFWHIKQHAPCTVKNRVKKKRTNCLLASFALLLHMPFCMNTSKTGWVHPLLHCKGRAPWRLLSTCASTGHKETTIKMVVLLHSPHFFFLRWWCFVGTQHKHWAPRKDKGIFSACAWALGGTNAKAHASTTSIDPIFDLPKFILSAVTIYWICDVTYLYVDTLQINITNLLFLISLKKLYMNLK